MIRALIFDFDGLIIDTESPDFASWQEVWREHGATLSLTEWAACIGTADAFDPYERLEQVFGGPVDRDAIRKRRRSRYSELLAQERPRPGVLRYIDDATALGLRLAIASSSTCSRVEEHLSLFDLASRFEVICGLDHVGTPKPAPAVYLETLRRLEVEPDEAIAFEDSPNGIAAARAAGVACVAVPCPLTDTLDLTQADMCIKSLEEVPLAALLERFGA